MGENPTAGTVAPSVTSTPLPVKMLIDFGAADAPVDDAATGFEPSKAPATTTIMMLRIAAATAILGDVRYGILWTPNCLIAEP